jgi:hypothetical protein
MAQKVQKHLDQVKNHGSSEVVTDDTQFLGQPVEIEDPVARFIAANYNLILGLVIAGLIGWFGYGYYSKQNLQIRRSGGDTLATVQAALEELETLDLASQDEEVKKKIETAKLKVDGGVKSLGKAIEPYPQMAQIYAALADLRSGTKKADQVKFFYEQGYATGEARLVQELQDLLVSKYLLDQDLEKGRFALVKLAEQGSYVAPAAISTLAKISETEEQRSAALKLADAVAARQPESAALLEEVRTALKDVK